MKEGIDLIRSMLDVESWMLKVPAQPVKFKNYYRRHYSFLHNNEGDVPDKCVLCNASKDKFVEFA